MEVEEELDRKRFRVAIFGSARIKKDDPNYKIIYNLSKQIAAHDIDVVTGGGPGIMHVVNHGHVDGRKTDTHSIGLGIELPHEQHLNRYLDIKKEFKKLSKRLDYFMAMSNVIVVAPAGGIGTLLELFYSWQLIQVNHTCRIPIILIGEMWKGLLEWIEKGPLKRHYLDDKDMDFVHCVDTYEEAVDIILRVQNDYLAGEPDRIKKYKL